MDFCEKPLPIIDKLSDLGVLIITEEPNNMIGFVSPKTDNWLLLTKEEILQFTEELKYYISDEGRG